MNERALSYRRIRMFCQVTARGISLATGISETRYAQIEAARREPNETERRLIEGFLRDKLAAVLAAQGNAMTWARRPAQAVEAGGAP